MIRDMRVELNAAVVSGMRAYTSQPHRKVLRPDVVDVVVDRLLPVVSSLADEIDRFHRTNLQNLESTVRGYAAAAVLPDGRLAYERIAGLIADLRTANSPVLPPIAPPSRKD